MPSTDFSSISEEINGLIAEAKLTEAFEQLSHQSLSSSQKRTLALIQNRYHRLQEKIRKGILSESDATLEYNKICEALLIFVNDGRLPLAMSLAMAMSPVFPLLTWLIGIGLMITLITVLIQLRPNVDSFSQTVLVHGKEGKDDRILRNQGKVVLDIGGDRKEEAINTQGEATFKELPAGYIGKQALISIDHPQPYFPTNRNREYVLEEGKLIYLEVELTGINKIKGTILDFETEDFLDSVRVSVENVAIYTNSFGWFELEIPDTIQSKFIQVHFSKPGYQTVKHDSIAPHTGQTIDLSLERKPS